MKKIITFFSLTLAILFFGIYSFAQEESIVYSIGRYENFKIIFNDETSEINLSDFTIYHISEYYTYDFYLFDVLEKNSSDIYEIKCITKNANYDYKIKDQNNKDLNYYDTLEIIIEKNKVLSITYIPLEIDDFYLLADFAKPIDFYENSVLVERLKQSLSYEFLFKSHITSQNENTQVINTQELTQDFQNSNVYCNKNNTVRYGACAEETSTNACINQLKKDNSFYKGQIFNRKQFTDSPLVYAIPKKYFMTRGIYSYIGPEYGFYINTYQDTGNDNMSNFLIFDIQEKKKAYNQNGEIIVKPILTGYTKYKRENQLVTFEIDSSNLALSNINIAVNLYNQTEKNIGDDGYIPEQDYGYAFKGFGVEAKASLNVKNYEPAFLLARLAAIGIGYIPKAGPIIKLGLNVALTYVEDYYNKQNYIQYHNITKLKDSVYSSSFSLNAADSVYSMIHEYGNLIKGINANLQTEEGELDENKINTILYKENKDDYFKLTYNFFQHNADICWDTSILTKLSLNIVEVNNNIEIKDSVTGSWVNSFNENPPIKETTMYLDNVYPVEYGIDGHQFMSFSPTYSGSYCFETYNTESDTIMELFENGSFIKKDDDGGSYLNSNNLQRCSKITWNLEYGKKYTIKIYGYNGNGGYCNVRVKKMTSDLKEYENNNFNCISNQYTSESYWQEFSPHKTGYYSFSVNSSNCAVNLAIYDRNHNRLASNYYTSYSGRVVLYLYLDANQKYYVQSKIHGFMGRNYTFGVFALSEKFILQPTELYSEQFYLDTGYTNTLYTIVVPETKNYSLGLHLVQGYNYIYLELYNENLEKIHSESFLGKEYMPINISLTKNKCYYLYIKQIPNMPDSYTTLTQANIFIQGV